MGRKKFRLPPFVAVRKDLLKDPEWRKLSSSAKVLYIYLRSKFNHKTLSNVTLTYSEVEDMMSSRTIRRAFKELIGHGWIERVTPGGLFGIPTVYKFIGPYKDFAYQGYRV